MYVGYLQFLMIAFVLMKQFDISIKLYYIPIIVIVFVVGCIFIGWADLKLGIRERENEKLSQQNPVTMEILTKLNYIWTDSKSSHTRQQEGQ